jgi:hypothetical protein
VNCQNELRRHRRRRRKDYEAALTEKIKQELFADRDATETGEKSSSAGGEGGISSGDKGLKVNGKLSAKRVEVECQLIGLKSKLPNDIKLDNFSAEDKELLLAKLKHMMKIDAYVNEKILDLEEQTEFMLSLLTIVTPEKSGDVAAFREQIQKRYFENRLLREQYELQYFTEQKNNNGNVAPVDVTRSILKSLGMRAAKTLLPSLLKKIPFFQKQKRNKSRRHRRNKKKSNNSDITDDDDSSNNSNSSGNSDNDNGEDDFEGHDDDIEESLEKNDATRKQHKKHQHQPRGKKSKQDAKSKRDDKFDRHVIQDRASFERENNMLGEMSALKKQMAEMRKTLQATYDRRQFKHKQSQVARAALKTIQEEEEEEENGGRAEDEEEQKQEDDPTEYGFDEYEQEEEEEQEKEEKNKPQTAIVRANSTPAAATPIPKAPIASARKPVIATGQFPHSYDRSFLHPWHTPPQHLNRVPKVVDYLNLSAPSGDKTQDVMSILPSLMSSFDVSAAHRQQLNKDTKERQELMMSNLFGSASSPAPEQITTGSAQK